MGSQRPAAATGGVPAVPLWAGMLVPPGAWMAQLFALYMLEDFISCTAGSQTPGVILGVGVKMLALGITGVLGAMTLGAGLVSLGLWRRMQRGSSDHTPAEKWMAAAGMMNSVLFLAIIVIKVAPPLLLGVCEAPW